MMKKIKKRLEEIKYRWWRINHEHDWKYNSNICGVHHEKGSWTEKVCQDPRCRQVEKIYV